MNRLLLFIFFLYALPANSQTNYLFIKKGGKKKRTYTEGSYIHFKLQDGQNVKGIITLLRNDTIFLNGTGISRKEVVTVILDEKKKKPFPADKQTLLAITAGVGLTTIGLSLNHENSPGKALIVAAVIGYGPLIIRHLFGRLIYTLYRKKFKIGKQYSLHVLDFYIPRNKAF